MTPSSSCDARSVVAGAAALGLVLAGFLGLQTSGAASLGALLLGLGLGPLLSVPFALLPRLSGARERAAAQDTTLLAHLLGGAAFNSFMGVAEQARGLGVGRALQRASLEDVQRSGGPGMFADSVYGGRQTAAEQAAERRTGTDPWQRRRVLGALGFRTVDIGYWQPVGGQAGGPVQDLDLLYAPLPGQPLDSVPLALVLDVLRAYWGGWLGAERAQQEVRALGQRAAGPAPALLPATETPAYWKGQGGGPDQRA